MGVRTASTITASGMRFPLTSWNARDKKVRHRRPFERRDRAATQRFWRGFRYRGGKESGEKTMRRALAVVVGLLVFVSILALTPPALSGRDRGAADAVVAELDVDYMRRVIEDLTSIGSSPLGFRTAGTLEDLETAEYVVAEMEDIGLEDAGIETVPVDMWRFRDASLTVTTEHRTRTFRAASQGGVPPTPKDGLTGEIVYVGKGRAMDYVALEEQGVSVDGKLVLADWDSDEVWT